jgi:hypothetical protein
MFYRILADRVGVIASMFHCSAFITTITDAFIVAISVTKLSSHSTYERADSASHHADIFA